LAKQGVDIFYFNPHLYLLKFICYICVLQGLAGIPCFRNPHNPQYPQFAAKPVFTRALTPSGLAFFSSYDTMQLQLKKAKQGTGANYESRQYL
jgi:hypothetical protein